MKNKKYIFIGKTLYFPKENILAVGDLHLGYDIALKSRGLEIPLKQFEEIVGEIEKIIDHIKARYGKIGELRIVFLGDIKHHFGFVASENEEVKKLLSFLRKKHIDENRVIFIRGNHEKNDKSGKFIDYYISSDIAFVHGDREFIEIYAKELNLIVLGHLHPSVTLTDEMKIKREKYKCFLVGRWKKKDAVILPSFMSTTEGVSFQEFIDEAGHDMAFIPNKKLEDFEVFVVQEIGSNALDFGKLGKLKREVYSKY